MLPRAISRTASSNFLSSFSDRGGLTLGCVAVARDSLMHRPFKNAALQPGDRLEKIAFPGSVWFVERLVEPRDQPPHAVIVYEKDHSETRLLALSVLLDESHYRRLSEAPMPPSDV